MNFSLAKKLIQTLPSGIDGLFNPWSDICPEDRPTNGPQEKLERLARHLDVLPDFIMCGEAPGYQGCRHSGVAFTSERLLLEGAIPRIDTPSGPIARRARMKLRLARRPCAYSSRHFLAQRWSRSARKPKGYLPKWTSRSRPPSDIQPTVGPLNLPRACKP